MKTKILHAALFTPMTSNRWGLPALFEGDPGVAKTSVIEQYAALWQMPCEVLSPGERGEGAFGVVPVPEKGKLTYPRPDYTDKFEKAGRGIVFVDEITSAPAMLQPPMLGLVAARRIGSYTLPAGVRVIGACNPVDVAANGCELSAPLANRFGWLKWHAPSVEEHCAFMMGVGGDAVDSQDPAVEEARVLKAWGPAFAQAVGLEAGFLRAMPHMKNTCPKVGDPAMSRAWASDRTWEYAVRAMASATVHGLDDSDRDEFAAAFIGTKVYQDFATYIEQADIPAAADVLDGKVAFKWEVKRLDRSAAIITACTALIVPAGAEKRMERASKLWEILLDTTHADITVPSVTALCRTDLHRAKEARPVLAKLAPSLRAAGINAGAGASL